MAQEIKHVELREIGRFASYLRSTDRKPMVVASVPQGAVAPSIDISEVSEELGDSFEYWVLESEQTFELTRSLGSKELSVHSGWLRIYPSDPAWQKDGKLARNFPPDPRHAGRILKRIVDHGLDLLFREGPSASTPAPVSNVRRVTAVVDAVINATQFIVKVPGERGQFAADSSALLPGIPADRLVSRGMKVDGVVTAAGILGAFNPDPAPRDQVSRAREFVGDAKATLALCTSVQGDRARLALVPGFDVELEAEANGDLCLLLEAGDLAAIEIVSVDGELVTSLTDMELEQSMSVLEGGPPWLVASDGVPDSYDEGQREIDDEGDTGFVEDDVASSVNETGELEAALVRVDRLEQLVETLRAELRKTRREAKAASKLEVPIVFDDPKEQLRFEVELAWLESIPNSQRKSEFPLPNYLVGPDFVASVEKLVGNGSIKRSRITEVLARVLCGQAKTGGSISPKPWNEGARGPQQTRSDNAVAWRARLQVNTSSARRLKYWVLPDGTIELESVGVHDDGIEKT